MNVIKRKALLDFSEKHPDAKVSLNTWFAVCRRSEWKTYHELQQDFPEAFPVGDNRVVFDIKGNRYRLVARVLFAYKQIQIKWIGTHAEYDRIDVIKVNRY
ncbi:MAG: type II toxin-antitoxin system HigB family toxin [Cyclobacteriaceae bacterium]|nr:type II toxin-antitoxin system HigB family toxin [Cyclobacteriaceae bacterium]